VLLHAFGLVLFTVVGVGYLLHWMIPALPLAACFALGAIVSPTDAVATAAMVGRVGLPARAATVLNGESLINDASGLVAFRFAIAALATGAFSLPSAVLDLVLVAAGGAAAGLAIAWAIERVRVGLRSYCADDPSVQTVLSLLTPFAAYLVADRFGLSGIFAVVVAGLYAGWNDFRMLDAATRQHAWEVWGMLLFAFNGFVFLLLGISLAHVIGTIDPASRSAYAAYALVLWALLTVLRLVWVFPATYVPQWISRRIREREGIRDPRNVFVVGWAGLRGSVTMAAALSIPTVLPGGEPFPHRDLLIFLAAATIVLSLVLNGLTLPLLVRGLGLTRDGTADRERRAAEIAIAQAATSAISRELPKLARTDEIAPARDLLAKYARRLERHTANAERAATLAGTQATERRLTLLGLAAERDELYALRDAGTINDETLREIEARLDAAEMYAAGALRRTG
jgi:CPA1 family monovalent cation:H+ antiporter